MKKNNKGFTLVEMIVTVALLGIISIISFPSLANLRSTYAKREYEVFESALESAAKLYVDSYAIDVFGYNEVGCNVIPMKDLIAKKLITDIDLKDVTCNVKEEGSDNDRSFVVVRKYKGSKDAEYSYAPHIYCTKKGAFVYESPEVTDCEGNKTGNPGKRQIHGNLDDKTDTLPPEITIDTKNKYVKSGTNIDVTITDKLSSGASGIGFNENAKIVYTWYKGNNVEGAKISGDKYSFRNKTVYGKATLKTSVKLPSKDGEITLEVKPDGNSIQDVNGNVTKDGATKTYIYDNTPPTITKIATKGSSTNNLSFTVSDNYVVDSYAVVPNGGTTTWKDINEKTKDLAVTLPTGTYTIKAKDVAGNETTSQPVKIEILGQPTVELESYNGGWVNKNVNVIVKYKNPDAVGDYEFSTDSGTTWKKAKGSISGVTDVTNGIKVPIAWNGITKIMFRVSEKNTDVKGPASGAYEVKIDKQGPSCNGNNGSTSWTNGNRTVTVNCYDGESGCAANQVSGTWSSGTVWNGNITIADKAGNATTCSVPVYIDKDAPNCGGNNGSYSWTGGDRTVYVDCNDNGSGCSQGSFGKTWNSTVRDDSIQIWDRAGNSRWCGVPVYVDKTPPRIAIYDGPRAKSCGGYKGLYTKYRVWDDESGLGELKDYYGTDASADWAYYNGTAINRGSKFSRGQWEFYYEHSWSAASSCHRGSSTPGAGCYYIKIFVKDAVGNGTAGYYGCSKKG